MEWREVNVIPEEGPTRATRHTLTPTPSTTLVLLSTPVVLRCLTVLPRTGLIGTVGTGGLTETWTGKRSVETEGYRRPCRPVPSTGKYWEFTVGRTFWGRSSYDLRWRPFRSIPLYGFINTVTGLFQVTVL